MTTVLATAIDNASSTLAVPHTSGGTSFTVRTGEGSRFGSPSPTAPIRFTVAQRSTMTSGQIVSGTVKTTFLCTVRTGDVLSGLTVKSGDTDHDFGVNDLIAILVDDAAINDLNTLALANEANIAGIVADATIVRTSGSYANPAWITSLAGSKVSGNITSNAASITGSITQSQVTGLTAALAAKADDSAVVHLAGSYADPSWITSLAGSKISGNITGNAASITGSITESQVTNLVSDLALKAPIANPSFTGDVAIAASGLYHVHIGGTPKNTVFFGLAPSSLAAGDFLVFGSNATAITGVINATSVSLNATQGVLANLKNTNSTSATADARWELTVGGASGGDPKFVYTVPSVQNWSHGLDNSDGDKFKLSASDTLGTSDVLVADPTTRQVYVNASSAGSAGAQLESKAKDSSTPSFAAYNSSGVARLTVADTKVLFGPDSYFDEAAGSLYIKQQTINDGIIFDTNGIQSSAKAFTIKNGATTTAYWDRTGALRVGDGQSLAPTYSFASATSTGLYNGGSFNFATGCSVAVSGRPRVSFTAVGGPQISLSAQASTHDVDAASFTATLPVTNETSRTGRLVVSVYDFTGAREVFRGDADGTQAKIGFLGASAVAKPTVTGSRGGNAALASLLTALASLGLITDSSTA